MTDRVEWRLRGRMAERFIGKALERGVEFQEVERKDGGEVLLVTASCHAHELMALAEEYRVDLTMAREQGWPLVRRRLLARSTLAAGLLLGAALIVLFCGCIWSIEAHSLDGLTDAQALRQIEATVRELGIRPGMARGAVDRDGLALDIQVCWPQLTYVSVRLRGVRLQIEVAEETSAPEVYRLEDSRDLVALRDAVVLKVNALSGKAAVQAGDTVRRGQVLIRGEEKLDRDGTMRGVRALGEVQARVWFGAECRLPLEETRLTRTGRCRISAEFRLFGWRWPLAVAEDYACQEVEREVLPVGGLYLPLRIERVIRWEAQEQRISYDREALIRQGEAWALELARGELPGAARETDFWIEHEERDGVMTVRATIEAQMDIAAAREQPASFE